jgi:hypothetical protein
MPTLRKGWIYLAGVAVLGLICGLSQGRISNPLLFAGAIVYLIGLRLLAEKFGK